MNNDRTPGMFGGYYDKDGKLNDFTPSYEFKPDHGWVMKERETNYAEYSSVKHLGGLICSAIIVFILAVVFFAISYLFDIAKDFIIK